MSVIPRMLKNGHDSNHGATKIELVSSTVELRFRPRPQSTGLNCRSAVVDVPASPKFFKNHQGTSKIHADVSTVLLRIMPMHHDLTNRGEP